MDVREEIIREIQRVARAIEPKSLTLRVFRREGRISDNKVRYHFGTWNEAVKAAGLKPNPSHIPVSGYTTLDDTELLQEIGDLWQRVGRRPNDSLMTSQGKFSTRPYKNRWGSFHRAVDEYIKLYGEPNSTLSIGKKTKHRSSTATTTQTRPIVVAPTHKPKAIANRQRILYGEPIDFRGLRYAPINEQGVVYLFGLVSRELGFLIESIRTDYPDCEGKRSLDDSGTKWQHVRIEFEYRSKNFVEHGHDPDECDLIVCWIHDWEDCPIEVLELRSAIDLLSPQ